MAGIDYAVLPTVASSNVMLLTLEAGSSVGCARSGRRSCLTGTHMNCTA
jgi:hypothetical protein